MRRSTLSDATIEDCAQYTQALMLLVGAFRGLPDLQGTFNTIYPRFTEDGGEKMSINHGEMRTYHGNPEPFIALTTKDDSGEKYLNLPLSNLSSPVAYARKLCAYNTRLGMYYPAPETIRECINTFYEKPQAERPKYFSVEDAGDKVLKRVAEYVKTTQGGYINLEQAREIVIQSMFEVGVLSEREEGIIESLRFTDYKEDIEALESPKETEETEEAHKAPEAEAEPNALAVSGKPPQIAATIVTLALMALGTLILFWHLLIQ